MEEDREVTVRAFSAYGRPLEMVTSFRYLGRVILEADNDCTEVARNLVKANAVWLRMTRIRSKEGAELRVSVFYFKAAVQLILLFGAETWMLTPRIGQVLGEIQYQLAQILTRGSHGSGQMGIGDKSQWRWQERRQDLRRWNSTSR